MFMDQKVVVITGAASGLGLALTKCCLQRKMCVVMADIASEALFAQVALLSADLQARILAVVCDVTDSNSVKNLVSATFDYFGRVDWLINNAGIIGQLLPIWKQTFDQIQQVMDVNLFGAIHCSQAFLPRMFEQNHRSHIINMSSVYGLCSSSFLSSYVMSKQALLAFSESLYFDLQRLKKPVDVSVVCPAFMNTALMTHSVPSAALGLHSIFCDLMSRSQPAEDIALQVIEAIEQQFFYVLPDNEVKKYCEDRTQAIISQQVPHKHNLERMFSTLSKRVMLDEI
jgi:NAD(P)-dependent dehydrogenase (short-subunit alcohol dehydrogenase family)